VSKGECCGCILGKGVLHRSFLFRFLIPRAISRVFNHWDTIPARLTKPRTSIGADRVVACSGVRVLGRDEVYGAYQGVSESVPPVGGGALVAAAPPRTLSRALVFAPHFLVGQGVARI
jgi:hypothetical protein